MKAEMKFGLVSWQAPNFAQVDVGENGDKPTVPVKDIETRALDALAEAWLADLYRKACKTSPFEIPRNLVR